MAAEGVGGQTNQLNTALGELGLKLGESTELGSADRGEVLRVGEEHDPVAADELVEVDGTVGGIGLEVGGNSAEAKTVNRGKVCQSGMVLSASGLAGSGQRVARKADCGWIVAQTNECIDRQTLTVLGEIRKHDE